MAEISEKQALASCIWNRTRLPLLGLGIGAAACAAVFLAAAFLPWWAYAVGILAAFLAPSVVRGYRDWRAAAEAEEQKP